MIKLKEIARTLESLAPLSFQESYDNSGLQVGDPEVEITGALITIDVTPEVIEEAAGLGFNLVVSHHPVIFGGLKSLTGRTAPQSASSPWPSRRALPSTAVTPISMPSLGG